ncbi:MAG: hypothetical protein ACM3XO_10195 [Bacteroidota bacterium]
MIFIHPEIALICLFSMIALILVIAGYTFIVNSRRSADDPKKQRYRLVAILLIPITVPFHLTLAILVFLFTALVYIGFFIIFTILLVVIRKWFFLVWWHKFATAVGDPLLKLNSSLIRSIIPQNLKKQPSLQPETSVGGSILQ